MQRRSCTCGARLARVSGDSGARTRARKHTSVRIPKCFVGQNKQAFLLAVLPAVVLLFVINGFTLSPVCL